MAYIQWYENSRLYRVFSRDIEDDLLEWHRDHNTRIVTVLEGIGWELQFDDQLPLLLKQHDRVVIKKGIFHRLFKGETDLKIIIEELDE
jgi:hypothetical protein